MRRVVSFLSAPGGVGKTSLCLTLSWMLREKGSSPFLFDLDPSLGLTLRFLNIHEYFNEVETVQRTSADLIRRVHSQEVGRWDEANQYVRQVNFKGIPLYLVPSSIRLEDVLGEIWHGSSLGRGKTLQSTLSVFPEDSTIFVDVIPCYELKYALLTLIASDCIVVPLRPTPNDMGRTILMMRQLAKKASPEVEEETFQSKLCFAFNMVRHQDEKRVQVYKQTLVEKFPGARVFREDVPTRVSFNRIGTGEERGDDEKNVKEVLRKFLGEFEEVFGSIGCDAPS
ncbi:MAG: ParA family protein [Promethearchaeota archaeon]